MTGTAQDFWTQLAEAPQGSRFERVNIPGHCLVELSPGEIQGQLAVPRAALLHETTLPGIWWVQEQGGNDYLEVGLCPAVVFQAGLAGTTTAPLWPDGLMNAPGLLAEALAHAQTGQALQVNLGMLPFNEADRAFLDQLSQQAAARTAHLDPVPWLALRFAANSTSVATFGRPDKHFNICASGYAGLVAAGE